MSKINDGGPAFPSHSGDPEMIDPRNRISCGGMTLRDWFAGQALAAMASTPKETTEAANAAGMSRTDFVTECAYQLADAMLKAREGGQP